MVFHPDLNGINASVPQGSILGPLLFLINVDDLVDDLILTLYRFADDTLSIFMEKHNSVHAIPTVYQPMTSQYFKRDIREF